MRTQAELLEANEKLEATSLTDGLTNFANRRHFDRKIADEIAAARRSGTALSLIMCDIDSFKSYNDTYGHPEGDTCIREIVTCIRETLSRETDFPARYGGEEFAIVLPNTDLTGAIAIAETIKQAIWDRRLRHEASDVAERVTLSLGVASFRPNQDVSMEAFIGRADAALYCAKENGRNQLAREAPVLSQSS